MAGIAIFGVTGRMGQTLIRALREAAAAGLPPAGAARAAGATGLAARLSLVGALASPDSRRLGQDAAAEGLPTGVMVSADAPAALSQATVAIDFSLPQCVAANARACAEAGVPLLLGTTGFDPAARAALLAAAKSIPVLIAPNTSVGVNVVSELVKLATQALRHGANEPRRDGEIGFSVVRAGDIVGEHTVAFAVAGERVEITHRASDRITFARGALRAAQWLIGRPPGLYSMNDVLGLDKA